MDTINTQSDFENLIRSQKALVFIAFKWSAPAHLSEMIVGAYRARWQILRKNLHVPIFKIEPDEYSFMSAWVYDEVKENGGWDSLVWIKGGAVVDHEANVVDAGIRDIARRTENIFRN